MAKKQNKVPHNLFSTPLNLEEHSNEKGLYQFTPTFCVQYSVTVQKNHAASYRCRGFVEVLNPDGSVYHRDGKAARKEIYTNDVEPNGLAIAINRGAQKLYSQYYHSTAQSQKDHVIMESMTMATLVELHKEAYLTANCKTPNARTEHGRLLNSLAATLGAITVGEIKDTHLKPLKQERPTNYDDYLREGSRFLEFLFRSNQPYMARVNCFQIFLDDNPRVVKSDPEKLKIHAVAQDYLTKEQYQLLSAKILEQQDTRSLWMGMGLILHACLTSKEACSITWNSIFYYPDNDYTAPCFDLTQLKPQHTLFCKMEEDKGAVHQLTFPLNHQARTLLCHHYKCLLNVYEPDALATMPIVTSLDPDAVPIAFAELTKFCRNVLLWDIGFNRDLMNDLQTNAMGGGVTVLHRTYHAMLSTWCGLSSDPSMVDFLSHTSLANSVQASNYRSFSDVTAHDFQNTAYRRVELTDAPPQNYRKTVISKSNESQTCLECRPNNSHGKTDAQITVTLEPGQIIKLNTTHGMKLSASIIHEDHEDHENHEDYEDYKVAHEELN